MKNYIIVDFSAGNLKTHHLDYVLTYAHFIKKNPKLFNKITKKRANFYINLIK